MLKVVSVAFMAAFLLFGCAQGSRVDAVIDQTKDAGLSFLEATIETAIELYDRRVLAHEKTGARLKRAGQALGRLPK